MQNLLNTNALSRTFSKRNKVSLKCASTIRLLEPAFGLEGVGIREDSLVVVHHYGSHAYGSLLSRVSIWQLVLAASLGTYACWYGPILVVRCLDWRDSCSASRETVGKSSIGQLELSFGLCTCLPQAFINNGRL